MPSEGPQLTSAEETWVTAEAAVGRFVHDETPTGLVNGSNTSFVVANTPTSGTLVVYEGGRRLLQTVDWSLSGTTITMTYAPPNGSAVRVSYRYA